MSTSVLLLLFLIGLRCSSALVRAYLLTSDPSEVANRTFSYVIVGGGTAGLHRTLLQSLAWQQANDTFEPGLTVANRLTEDDHVTVLVIESGSDHRSDPRITDPGNWSAFNFTGLTVGYVSTNQTIGGKSLSLITGQALGGSSTINGMQWTRGTAAQYDAFEQLGNPGWNFASLQKYMKKAEAFHAPNAAQISRGVKYAPSAHGTSGHVVTGFPNPYPCPVCTVWDTLINSSAQVFPELRTTGNIDPCSGDPRGAARSTYSIKPGSSTGPEAGQNVRSSSAQSYLYSFSPGDRPNLSILVEHRATKIIWDTIDSIQVPKARGIAFQAQDSPSSSFLVNIEKEVIVSAGTLGTPKFLELSGIGSKSLLERMGIPVVVDLPAVGTNLQDQAQTGSFYSSAHQLNHSVSHAPASGVAAFLTLSQILGTEAAQAYVERLKETINQRANNIVTAGAGVSALGMQKMLELQAKQFGEQEAPVVEIVYGVTLGQQSIPGVPWILLPQYRGTAHLSSADPEALPTINPNYLTVPEDLTLLVNASMANRQVFSTPSARTLWSAELVPGPAVQTEDQWFGYVRANYNAVGHFIGTASMLPRELGGVVDANLSVYGVRGVRVADASIMPLQISAHLSSTVYGIAEKAADLIKGI